MMRAQLTELLTAAIDSYLATEGLRRPADLAIEIEQPARAEHGDWASPVPLRLAKALKRAPLTIAQGILVRIAPHPLVAKVEVAPPGFLNLWIDWAAWAQGSGEPTTPTAGGHPPRRKVVVEHTSINPNKAAHIGHLRNSVIGDTLARLMRQRGYQVEVHNYIDDLGNQVADTVVGLLETKTDERFTRFGDFCWAIYAQINQRYQAEPTLTARRTEVLHALEEGKGNLAWLGSLVAERIVREHVAEMTAFGINYDLLVWESNIVREGFWATTFALLQHSPLFAREHEGKLAGCWVLRSPGTEADETTMADPTTPDQPTADKVLVRSNGVLTYTAKDIAYHLWKFGLLGKEFRYQPFEGALWTSAPTGKSSERFGHADRVLNVIDKRQEYPQAMVKLALQTLGFEAAAQNLHHVAYGVVSLSPATAARLGIDTSDGKSSYAMSGRQGIGIKVADLLGQMEAVVESVRPQQGGIASREIAAAAIRYHLLKYGLGTEICFDLDQAAELHGNSGVYLLYAHARAAGILRKGALGEDVRGGAENQSPSPPFPTTLALEERALLKHLATWPEVLAEAEATLAPQILCTYAYELAALFHTFYAACPVLKGDTKAFRLWLTESFRQTLAEALDVLGLPAPTAI
ncbi:MAG TPA: arginine--tRNA ligase [Symbiobacteriaceae bacterium]|nr:arginine--tRNA ligase [Symbiobacteriaceae bacterium]